MMKVIHQERVLERFVAPHIQEHVVEVMKVIHQERVLERIEAPHIQEHVVQVMKGDSPGAGVGTLRSTTHPGARF